MTCSNLHFAKRITDERLHELLRETEIRRMLREAGIDQKYGITRQVRRLRFRLGHMLVSLGRRLECFDASIERQHPAGQSHSAQL
jgi:hypothetical protein